MSMRVDSVSKRTHLMSASSDSSSFVFSVNCTMLSLSVAGGSVSGVTSCSRSFSGTWANGGSSRLCKSTLPYQDRQLDCAVSDSRNAFFLAREALLFGEALSTPRGVDACRVKPHPSSPLLQLSSSSSSSEKWTCFTKFAQPFERNQELSGVVDNVRDGEDAPPVGGTKPKDAPHAFGGRGGKATAGCLMCAAWESPWFLSVLTSSSPVIIFCTYAWLSKMRPTVLVVAAFSGAASVVGRQTRSPPLFGAASDAFGSVVSAGLGCFTLDWI